MNSPGAPLALSSDFPEAVVSEVGDGVPPRATPGLPLLLVVELGLFVDSTRMEKVADSGAESGRVTGPGAKVADDSVTPGNGAPVADGRSVLTVLAEESVVEVEAPELAVVSSVLWR